MKNILKIILILAFWFVPNFTFGQDCSKLDTLIKQIKNDEKALLDLANRYPKCGNINYELGIYYEERKVWKAANRHYLKAYKFFPNDKQLNLKIKTIKNYLPERIENEQDAKRVAVAIVRRLVGTKPIEKPSTSLSFGEKVLFDFDSAALKPESKNTLDHIIKGLMSTGGKVRFTLQGHTDNIGTEEYNKELSIKRAEAVRNYMVQVYGYPSENIKVEGYGSKGPLDTNLTEQGRRVNRRVDFEGIPH